ncbi:hypothetical protein GBAR_LOCUS15655, partial [Geodia barretti]
MAKEAARIRDPPIRRCPLPWMKFCLALYMASCLPLM